MNERIRELWNQSRYPSGRGHDEEKFAELIVRECASKVTRNEALNIFEHFGVGE